MILPLVGRCDGGRKHNGMCCGWGELTCGHHVLFADVSGKRLLTRLSKERKVAYMIYYIIAYVTLFCLYINLFSCVWPYGVDFSGIAC
jgi:hypothetical protein